mmetsp:Transcript_78503/g.254944  ORF Transcript_78503/g.254944 Transcript_78503/m.254944 type:complete len:229 (-) Transcript_78503:146-832(-)
MRAQLRLVVPRDGLRAFERPALGCFRAAGGGDTPLPLAPRRQRPSPPDEPGALHEGCRRVCGLGALVEPVHHSVGLHREEVRVAGLLPGIVSADLLLVRVSVGMLLLSLSDDNVVDPSRRAHRGVHLGPLHADAEAFVLEVGVAMHVAKNARSRSSENPGFREEASFHAGPAERLWIVDHTSVHLKLHGHVAPSGLRQLQPRRGAHEARRGREEHRGGARRGGDAEAK